MQPLFVHTRLLLGVWLASLLIWRVMEASVDIRTLKRLRAGTQRQDKGSHVVLLCLSVFGLLLGLLLALKVPVTAITSARVFLFWLGILLIYAGIAFRLYAITVLGAFFTTTVAVAAEQTVIEAGPYRLIRHPSYTGFLIILLGLGLSLTNWLSALLRQKSYPAVRYLGAIPLDNLKRAGLFFLEIVHRRAPTRRVRCFVRQAMVDCLTRNVAPTTLVQGRVQ